MVQLRLEFGLLSILFYDHYLSYLTAVSNASVFNGSPGINKGPDAKPPELNSKVQKASAHVYLVFVSAEGSVLDLPKSLLQGE